MDDHVRLLPDDLPDRREEIIVHLLLAEVHPGPGVEPAEGGEPEVGVGDVGDLHASVIWLEGRGIITIGWAG